MSSAARHAATVGCLILTGCATAGVATTHVPLAAPTATLEQLEAALASDDVEMRTGAAWQLAGSREVPDRVRARLVSLAESDPSAGARAAAVWAINHLKAPADASRLYDEPPRPVRQVRPEYPAEAREKRVQGTVLVEVLIDEDGRVVHAEVRESIPVLDAAALAAARRWTFKPALRNGKPVACLAHIPARFRIL